MPINQQVTYQNKPYKSDLFLDELLAQGINSDAVMVKYRTSDSTLIVHYDDNVLDVATINATEASHDATDESVSEAIQSNRTILVDNTLSRFKSEIEADTPDWNSLYSDILTALTPRPLVLARMQNMSELIARALGIADLSLLLPAQRNAIRLVAVILVLVIYR